MMQQDYGAAQGLIDLGHKYYNAISKLGDFLNKVSTPGVKDSGSSTDMNWKPEPNAEQQKWLDEHGYGQKKLAARKPLGSAKTTKKKAGKKSAARKKAQ